MIISLFFECIVNQHDDVICGRSLDCIAVFRQCRLQFFLRNLSPAVDAGGGNALELGNDALVAGGKLGYECLEETKRLIGGSRVEFLTIE